ncbi:hypothetical protein FRB90_012396, partial [Tulasnella sp. 427]
MIRRVTVKFYGRAAYFYGPPVTELEHLPGRIQVTLDANNTATIDLEERYRELDVKPWEPQMLYYWKSDHASDAPHVLEISLLDAPPFWAWDITRAFGFDSLVYTSEVKVPPKYELRNIEKLQNTRIHDTNFATAFGPPSAWTRNTSDLASSSGPRTFHATSNELAYPSVRGLAPVVEFTAQCTALAVYGASPAQLEATFPEGFRHGHVQLCLGQLCHYLDVHSAYLNVPKRLLHHPILIFSTDRMWPGVLKPVTMRFLDPPSPVGHLWTMSFSYADCAQVVPRWPWTHPMPGGQYSSHVLGPDKLDYEPSFFNGSMSPWSFMEGYSFASAVPFWLFGLFGDMPSWSTVIVHAYEIKIFIPLPALYPLPGYSNVLCCINDDCHYPDIQQWFLTANDSTSELPLVHYKDLNPFVNHRISITAVRRADEHGHKIIAVSRVEYHRMEFPEQLPKPPQPPPEPTVPFPYPTPPKLATDIWEVIIQALCLFVVAIAGYNMGLCLHLIVKFVRIRTRPESTPLLWEQHSAPPSYVSYGAVDYTPAGLAWSHEPITQPACLPNDLTAAVSRDGCMKRYDPFTMSTYVDPDSKKRTFFQTSSWGNEPNSANMRRRVEIAFHGRAVEVYGPPQAQLDNRPGHIQISLNGLVLTIIDLESKYREANNEPWNPLLMFRWEGGDYDSSYTLVITLLDSATGVWKWHPIRGFGFESVVVTSLDPWRPPRYQLSESEKLEDVIIHDTNFVTTFGPSFAWEKQISGIASSDGIRTFHGTSNELAYSSWTYGVTPVAEFSAQCAALAVYGASPAQLHATFREGFRHGHLQLCQGSSCEYIDAHQAYLNVPDNLWNEPVLLYQTDRMSPSSTKTVSMRLLDPPSPVGHLWTMTLSHAICSQVVPKWPWTHPIPHGNYSEHTVGYGRLDYAPTFLFGLFSPWSWMPLYSFAAAKPSWFSFGNLPSWSTTLYAHDIQIFIPFPALFPALRYADVRCCIDGRCHYPDVEQWYLKARDSGSEVPLVHVQDLHPFRAHHISMTAVRRSGDAGEKIIAVSRIEYQRVVNIQEPNPTPAPPRP